MWCIQFRTPLIPSHSHLKHKQHLSTPQLLRFSINEPANLIPLRPNHLSLPALRAYAIPNSLVLGVSSPARSGGDLSVLLLASVALFFLYFITNFIVPSFISKSFQLDNTSEDQERNDDSSI
ncbi:hypothetical protein I3843_12G130400 [Carya illinoinensis]|uniref:Transmembrane protein n=1 Tax=Carya illinoinensis TaxID=32201 RepID=A0A8T1NYE5_CARIL|nr:uncharacterized protein LOC122289829 [Carya illinoinensis]KAG2678110.1 hypothetical protein I3760_12G128200 [Carya illinoinensis]KAG6634641.1 hypothetical protein CIPAW_12G131500 [Carya illinoinensis]KAG6685811.1 hypothetical protein I3842_12G130400 [Carya illinoinensis]KAG7953858.1 hypothetical protein I3843_12G130400 [Carya illinoinensis]